MIIYIPWNSSKNVKILKYLPGFLEFFFTFAQGARKNKHISPLFNLVYQLQINGDIY